MELNTHTPGPWVWWVDTLENRAQDMLGSPDYKTMVLQALWKGRPADARLIAMAPELLAAGAALAYAIRNYRYDHDEEGAVAECLREMDAAIAKATGGQPSGGTPLRVFSLAEIRAAWDGAGISMASHDWALFAETLAGAQP